jgi:2'-5' RNA ligase
MHFTLKFLGDVETERLAPIAAAIDAGCAGIAPFAVELTSAGVFPSPARPRTLWLGAGSGGAGLARLAAAVEEALAPLGFPAEGRPFVPHVTIGRVKGPLPDPAALQRLVTAARGRAWGGFPVPAVHLERSDLFPSGPTYSILHETCLSGTPRAAEGAQ